jgi:hypothetical protein
MDLLPGDQRNIQSLGDGGCRKGGTLHQAGVHVGQPKAITVLNIPLVFLGDCLIFLEKICQNLGLLMSDFGQGGVGAFLIARVAPICVVYVDFPLLLIFCSL